MVSLICPIESLLCRLEFPVLIFHHRGAKRTKAWLWNGSLGEFNGQLSRRKSLEFPVFFLVTGNLGREGFAPDWILRHVSTTWLSCDPQARSIKRVAETGPRA
jgi:hypothetical protein